MGVQLANLRLAFECKQSWADMAGDDRVRHCAGCDKDVFNLSAMTEADAEALLATRGIKPCVRFYRRADGTVMTSDCPAGRPQRRKLAVVASGVAASMAATAYADDAPIEVPGEVINVEGNAPIIDQGSTSMGAFYAYEEMGIMNMPIGVSSVEPPPLVEWSVWGRIGTGVEARHPDVLARGLTMPAMDHDSVVEAALDAEVTLGVAHDGMVRLGAYGELRTQADAVLGGELMFEGEHALVVRAGAGAHLVTAGLGVGFVARYPDWAHHVFGARVMATFDRSDDDPREWSATIGLEVDPIGVLQYLRNR
ncbi:MAG: hypothetical protein QM831_23380 [Kofleriaceae bacterium]